jgi:hypothetical protein
MRLKKGKRKPSNTTSLTYINSIQRKKEEQRLFEDILLG